MFGHRVLKFVRLLVCMYVFTHVKLLEILKYTSTFSQQPSKESLSYIVNSTTRAEALSKRKSTLFSNAFKLNVMTGAKVFLAVESPENL